MNECEIISIIEVHSGKIVEQKYWIVDQSGKKGLRDISEPKCEVLPCAYESLDTLDWDPNDPAPGILIKKDGLYGYFCNRNIVVQCEFDRIEVRAWNVKYMELQVEHEGLEGLIVVDFSNNTAHTRIPIAYHEIRYGTILIACQSKDAWSIYSRPIKKAYGGDSCDYFMRGKFKTITTQYAEPYPVQNNMILLPDIVWWEVDKIEEIIERHHYSDNVIRTIITKAGKLGLWDNKRRVLILKNKYDQLISIKDWVDEDNEDCSLFMLAENGKAGVYNAKYSCFVLNPIYDSLSYLNDNKTFLTSLNGKKGVLSLEGDVLIPHLYNKINLICKKLMKEYSGGRDNIYVTTPIYTAEIDGKLDLYSKEGKLLFNKRYDKIEVEKTALHHTDSIYFNMEETLLVKVYEGKMVGLFIETDFGFSSAFACEYDSIVYVPEMDVFITKQKNVIKHFAYLDVLFDLKKRND